MSNRSIVSSLVVTIGALIITGTSSFSQQLYSAGTPTNEEQYMLELINRARANGTAEAARWGLQGGLQEGPPNYNGETWTIQNSVQPVAWNQKLADAAQGQADLLNNSDQFFTGTSPHTFGGTTPDQRVAAKGYTAAQYNGPTTTSGFYPGIENVSEAVSIGQGGYTGANLAAAVLDAHKGLFTDNGMFGGNDVPGRGHRNTMMLGFFRELGVGINVGTDNNQGSTWDSFYSVMDYDTQTNSTPFITGAIYHDTNGDGFYNPGEGIAGISVTIAGANFYAVTSSSGGYAVPVPGNGTYTVSFSAGSGFPANKRTVVVANGLNAKVDSVLAPKLANISTRMNVKTGDNVLIGGFIITGVESKRILLRGIGPSLTNIPGRLSDPVLELYDANSKLITSNDNWKDASNRDEITATGAQPTNDLESAILTTLAPGTYTAIVRGAGTSTGIGLVEGYDLDAMSPTRFANISTRGSVETGDNAMIGGFIVLQEAKKVLIRAIGPSLTTIPNRLMDPTLELRDGNGQLITQNDNWKSSPQQAEIQASGIAPTNDAEAAILTTLQPAAYTAIVRGAGDTVGVALVEVYGLN